MKTTLPLLLIIFTMGSTRALADHGKEGGDPVLTNKADTFLYLEDEVRREILATKDYILSRDVDLQDRDFKQLVAELGKKGLETDVLHAPYTYEKKCFDRENTEKSASTEMDESNGSVCWSIDSLLEKGAKRSDILGLAFHEHIHHFGLKDTDHLLASRFKKYYLKRSLELELDKEVVETEIQRPTISVGGERFLLEARNESMAEYCRLAGFRSAKGFKSKIIVMRGNPKRKVLIEAIRPGGKLSYANSAEAENFLDFMRMYNNGYGGGVVVHALRCTSAIVPLSKIIEEEVLPWGYN